jgi:hypothetical protein
MIREIRPAPCFVAKKQARLHPPDFPCITVSMPQNPNEHFDHNVLDMIEHSPVGAVPATPAYQDALKRLYASHQAYPDADHKDGHVTARSLARLPLFHASNLAALGAGSIGPEALEPNAAIFDRYVASLPADRRARAEARRLVVVGRSIHHRAKHAGETVHDPVHSLFLVPGSGPNPGLPGNYLHGSLYETGRQSAPWAIIVHDSYDGATLAEMPSLADALSKLDEVLASAPFTMAELDALGFKLI